RLWRSGERVLEPASGLHDPRDVRALVLEDAKVAIRIAVDDEQVGVCAGYELAELALAAHDLRIDERRRLNHFVRRHRLRTDQEFLALVDLQRAEQIGAEADAHASRAAELERAQSGLE